MTGSAERAANKMDAVFSGVKVDLASPEAVAVLQQNWIRPNRTLTPLCSIRLLFNINSPTIALTKSL
jgi:hypothetical protein